MKKHVLPRTAHIAPTSPQSPFNFRQRSSISSDSPASQEKPLRIHLASQKTKVTCALLLAAGTGTRLKPLTTSAPKCLTEINGVSILERLISNLRKQGFKRLIVVIGHLGDQIQKSLELCAADMQIDYVTNPVYRTTNNLYSLWLARKQINESFLLVESDLIFKSDMLGDMLYPDKIAVSRMLPWMNGTTVELDSKQKVTTFCKGDESSHDGHHYKTVNVYSLSLASWKKIEVRLTRYVAEKKLGDYYEVVFTEMIADHSLSFEAVFFEADLWYEIDTGEDLLAAEILFAGSAPISRRSPEIAESNQLLPS